MSALKGPFSAIAMLVAAALLTLGSAGISRADTLRDEIREFHVFLRHHPQVANELQRNPGLADNRRYLDRHDDLRDFLRSRPRLRREIVERPRRVLANRYAWDDGYGDRWRYR
jgi:hypothetical protein